MIDVSEKTDPKSDALSRKERGGCCRFPEIKAFCCLVSSSKQCAAIRSMGVSLMQLRMPHGGER